MKDKEKQIEEMAKGLNYNCKSSCYDNGCYKRCSHYYLSELFYNAGCRKINENEVVISKEEYESLVTRPNLHTAIDVFTVRKETAEKFAKELRNFIYLCDDLELDADTYGKISNKMDEITKQFGVDIGEEK